MKRIPLKELKQKLSSIALIVVKGQPVEVTKHNKPYFYMTANPLPGAVVGKYFGKKSLEPGPVENLSGKTGFLEELLKDREDRF